MRFEPGDDSEDEEHSRSDQEDLETTRESQRSRSNSNNSSGNTSGVLVDGNASSSSPVLVSRQGKQEAFFSASASELEANLSDHDDATDYYTDDSEDLLFPVSASRAAPVLDSSTTWSAYESETTVAARTAAHHQAAQLDRAAALHDAWARDRASQRRQQEQADWRAVTDSLGTLSLAQQAEDAALQQAWQDRSEALELAIQETIKGVERDAEARQERLLAAERERARRQAEAASLAKQQAEAAQRAKEEAERVAQEQAAQEEEAARLAEAAAKAKTEAARKLAQMKVVEARRATEAQAKAEAGRVAAETAASGPRKEAEAYRAMLVALEKEVLEPVASQATLRDFCRRARPNIVRRVGQVTNSLQSVRDVASALHAILTEANRLDPRCLRWCLNQLCKNIAKQSEEQVSAKLISAYPFALVCLLLMNAFSELKPLLLARLAKKCPWTVPFVDYSLDTESGRKLLGYKRLKTEHYESHETYRERQTGLFALYAATTALHLEGSPMPTEMLWQTLSRLMNANIADPELRNTSFALLSIAFDIAGPSLLKAFVSDLGKELILTAGRYVGNQVAGPQAVGLRIKLQDFLERNTLGVTFEFEP